MVNWQSLPQHLRVSIVFLVGK